MRITRITDGGLKADGGEAQGAAEAEPIRWDAIAIVFGHTNRFTGRGHRALDVGTPRLGPDRFYQRLFYSDDEYHYKIIILLSDKRNNNILFFLSGRIQRL